MKEVVIVSAVRTPIGSFMGQFSFIPATHLGAAAIKAALNRVELDPNLVDEVFMGHVLQAGTKQAPARNAALLAGINESTPCTTVNKVCSSGLKSVMLATQSILLGDAEIIVAGGMESMSQVPHYQYARKATKYGGLSMLDGIMEDGLSDAKDGSIMGECAELCAEEHSLSREDQDQYAQSSYERSTKAWEDGAFTEEITPVAVPQRRGEPIIISEDEEYKKADFSKFSKLRSPFKKDGSVTAANASTLNDGASAIVLMSKEKAEELGLKPLARILSYADAAKDPKHFTIAPSLAIPKALKKANMTIDQIDYFEINEAFSAVALANTKLLGLNSSIVNVHGGAVSLGHPLGNSGSRILVTLLNVLKRNNAQLGVAGICNGGGGASAMIIENL